MVIIETFACVVCAVYFFQRRVTASHLGRVLRGESPHADDAVLRKAGGELEYCIKLMGNFAQIYVSLDTPNDAREGSECTCDLWYVYPLY